MTEEFKNQREAMVERYLRLGFVHSERMAEAMRKVPRELFMPREYRRYAYYDEPFPIPGNGNQTISAPYTYALFYEPLDLKEGDKFLEVGTGSGYGAALAWELVKEEGTLVTIETNPVTYDFGKNNLKEAGYHEIVTVCGDGSKGYPEKAPYDKICVTAACPEIPPPLKEQLQTPGKLVAPVGPPVPSGQDLTLLTKDRRGNLSTKKVSRVVYVPLKGEHGWNQRQSRVPK